MLEDTQTIVAEDELNLDEIGDELKDTVILPFVSRHRVALDHLQTLVGRSADEGGRASMITVWRDNEAKAIVEWCEGRVIWHRKLL